MSTLPRQQLRELAAEVLGLDTDPDEDEVSTAYRNLSLEFHPDQGDDPDAERFKAITRARDILTDDEYLDDPDQRRNAERQILNVVDRDIQGEAQEQEVIDDFDVQDARDVHLEFAISITVDLVLEEFDQLFTIPVQSQEFTEDIFAQLKSEGYNNQTYENIKIEEFASILEPFAIEGIGHEDLVDLLQDADAQLRERFGQFTNIFAVSQVIGGLMASGIISPADLSDDQDTGPWEYSSSGDSGPWTRSGNDQGPWSR